MLADAEVESLIDLLFKIQEIPASVVDATPFDDHVDLERQLDFAKTRREKPWAGSGHYGKELNLMLSGHKKVALVYPEELPFWQFHLDFGRFIAVWQEAVENYIITTPEFQQLATLIEHGSTEIVGIALGYLRADVRTFEERILALRG